jgi:Spy/CpxP family protein refolding chaperone
MLNRSAAAALILLGALLLAIIPLSAKTYSTPLPTVNDKDVALLRNNLQAEAKQLITKNMQLTDSEASAFWPLYDQYTAEVRQVNDTRFGLVKQYAKVYKTMTSDEADNMVKLLAEADQTVISLRMQYLPRFQQALPGSTKAALFMQLDRRLDSLFNVQIASQLPAIKP